MTPYAVETMSRHELRKCYNRYCWAVMLLYPTTTLTGVLLSMGAFRFLPELFRDPAWQSLLSASINALSGYVPTLLVFLLVLRRLPRAEKLPVDRLGLWEFFQALVFTLGVCFLFSLLTQYLITFLEQVMDSSAVDRLTQQEENAQPWELLVFTVLIPPVCEEYLFRRLLLDRLRALGDVSAVFLSALAFALFHNNFYQMLYAFVLGAFFAMLVLLTGSIRDTILLHMCVNGFTALDICLGLEWFSMLRMLSYFLCAGAAVGMFFGMRSCFRLESGPLALSPRDKRRACFGSPWFYLMLVVCAVGGVVTIFQ